MTLRVSSRFLSQLLLLPVLVVAEVLLVFLADLEPSAWRHVGSPSFLFGSFGVLQIVECPPLLVPIRDWYSRLKFSFPLLSGIGLQSELSCASTRPLDMTLGRLALGEE